MTERYMILDLWMASGRDAIEFETFVDEHGDADTWSLLLAEVRCKPQCGARTDSGPCVLSQHDPRLPHYAADDVASPVRLPRARCHGMAARDAVMTRLFEGWLPHRLSADGSWWWGMPREPGEARRLLLHGMVASMSDVTPMTEFEVAALRAHVSTLAQR